MSEFPRTQKIAALALVTLVVIMTLIVLAARDDGNSFSADDSPPIDPNAEPTAIPVLERPRGTWDDIASIVRGAQGTSAPVDCPFVDERILETNNFLALAEQADKTSTKLKRQCDSYTAQLVSTFDQRTTVHS